MLLLAKDKFNSTFERVNAEELCKNVVSVFSGAYHREIHLQSKDQPVYIHGNEDQLQQVLYILLDNALKYSEKDVQISLSSDSGNLHIVVRDFGEGISTKDQEHIFDRFYRVDEARSRHTGGAGLGL